MLECTDLTKSYKEKCVVNGLSFSVRENEVFAFLFINYYIVLLYDFMV